MSHSGRGGDGNDPSRRPVFPDDKLYPAPQIKWYSNISQHPSVFLGVRPNGFEVPVDEPEGPTDIDDTGEFIVVTVDSAEELAPLECPGTPLFRVTAHYQSEEQDVVERRMTPAVRAIPSSADPLKVDCTLNQRICVPFNSREQFVKVGIYQHTLMGDSLVGEATVPIADPSVSSTSPWPLLRDFEDMGVVMLSVSEPTSDLPVDTTPPPPPPVATICEDMAVQRSLDGRATPTLWQPQQSQPQQPQHRLQQPPVQQQPTALQQHQQPQQQPQQQAQQHMEQQQQQYQSQMTQSYRIGDPVEVYSKSEGRWVSGNVAKVSGNGDEVTLEYGGRGRVINLRAPWALEYLRRPTKLSALGSNATSSTGVEFSSTSSSEKQCAPSIVEPPIVANTVGHSTTEPLNIMNLIPAVPSRIEPPNMMNLEPPRGGLMTFGVGSPPNPGSPPASGSPRGLGSPRMLWRQALAATSRPTSPRGCPGAPVLAAGRPSGAPACCSASREPNSAPGSTSSAPPGARTPVLPQARSPPPPLPPSGGGVTNLEPHSSLSSQPTSITDSEPPGPLRSEMHSNHGFKLGLGAKPHWYVQPPAPDPHLGSERFMAGPQGGAHGLVQSPCPVRPQGMFQVPQTPGYPIAGPPAGLGPSGLYPAYLSPSRPTAVPSPAVPGPGYPLSGVRGSIRHPSIGVASPLPPLGPVVSPAIPLPQVCQPQGMGRYR